VVVVGVVVGAATVTTVTVRCWRRTCLGGGGGSFSAAGWPLKRRATVLAAGSVKADGWDRVFAGGGEVLPPAPATRNAAKKPANAHATKVAPSLSTRGS
jgi:hypothetical protein